jgi:hypothetical protein
MRISEVEPYLIFAIIIACFKVAITNWELYNFWQPIIDNFILLVFLIFMALRSSRWGWLSKRITYCLIFIIILNTYTKLFGMEPILYLIWYSIPLVSLAYSISITSIIEISYKLYILWRNGKIKFY